MTGDTARKRGRSRELRVADVLRLEGWVVYRLAWGHADVIALKAGHRPLLVQVKSTTRPFEHFGPRDRVMLMREGIAADCEVTLAWWPKNGSLRWLPPDVWPNAATVAA